MPRSRIAEGPAASASVADLLRAGRQAVDRGDAHGADVVVERLIAVTRTLDDPVAAIGARLLGARSAILVLAFDRAMSLSIEAVAIAQRFGQPGPIADSILVLARVSYAIGDFEQALVELERVRPLLPGSGSDATSFAFQVFLGNVHLALRQYEPAIEAGLVAERIAIRLDDPRSRAVAAGNLASYWLADHARRPDRLGARASREGLERALASNLLAMRLAAECGACQLDLSHFSNHAGLLEALGRDEEAFEWFARHRALASRLRHSSSLPTSLLAEARLERRLGRTQRSRDLLREGIEIGEGLKLDHDLGDLYALASEIAEGDGDFQAALGFHKSMYGVRTRSVTQAAEQRSLVMAVRLATDRATLAATTERERAERLCRSNEALERHAERLSREALEDALTGLANRRLLDSHLARCHVEARIGRASICLAMLDVDFFKQVNDRFSHGVGDEVLRRIGALLRAACRDGDLAARSGGEEFVLCLHDVAPRFATAACERVRDAIEGFDWDSVAPGLSVTVSIGATDLGAHANPFDAMTRADEALYRAKRAGRNRVCLADEERDVERIGRDMPSGGLKVRRARSVVSGSSAPSARDVAPRSS